MNYWKLTLSYDGTNFHGWQVQPGLATIQGTLAAAIERIAGEAILPQGSGRTDAGVHALAQVASFALQSPVPAANLQRALNRTLPTSIRILSIDAVPGSFHARHSARAKTYEYRIFERKPHAVRSAPERICPPFLSPYVWDCRWTIDLDSMQQAAAQLCGTHDFTSFAASDPDLAQRSEESSYSARATTTPNPVKHLFTSTITRDESLLVYRVTGSGFLHHMVRNIVGTLVEIGRGSLAPSAIPRILAARDRAAAGPTAPATGLYLHSVEYAPSTEAIP